MPIKTRREKKSVFIEASGSLGVEQADEMLQTLRKALSGTEGNIEIDLWEVAESDITCLQIICSAHKSARKLGKTITISKAAPDLLQTVSEAGLTGQNDCASEMSGSCPWNMAGVAR